MKRNIYLLLILFAGGCAVTTVSTPPEQPAALSSSVNHVFASDDEIRKLLVGVSREETLALIGRTTAIGYELRQGSVDEYQAVTMTNPQKSQQYTVGKNVYQVDYYVTRINKADGLITEDELTPVVFESNKLVGKGWDFFNSKIKKQ